MKVRIGNCGDRDLIVQSSGAGHRALSPLGFGQKIARDYVEIDIGDNELLILRARGAKDPEGRELRTPV